MKPLGCSRYLNARLLKRRVLQVKMATVHPNVEPIKIVPPSPLPLMTRRIVHDGGVHVCYGSIVVISAFLPVTAVETDTGVAESEVNSAIEADFGSPVARARYRSRHPSPSNPESKAGRLPEEGPTCLEPRNNHRDRRPNSREPR